MTRFAITCAALALSAASAHANDAAITFDYDGSFDDATFALEDAIISKGLVIDHRSHTGEMLERTRADVGSDVVLFDAADVFLFCSATISRQVMEADPDNIVYCPYSIYVTDREGKVTIGFPDYPDGSMQPVEDLLTEIVESAVSF
ncbi:DUF302 domain-containing protein [Celeribacter sp.]|uniref:DUF302 domain-containing protein n=1 Tax=Celeribacter sp. TaxID=1890673 RepID=UPI003A929B51